MNTEKKYIIRQATIEDAPEIARIAARGLPGYPFEYVYNPHRIATEIIQGSDYRVVAYSQEMGVMGTAVLELAGPMTEVKRVVVDPMMRNNGIARSMTQHLVNEAVLRNLVPWSDVRSDQIGMQRSALASGLRAICLEQGKHVVYKHMNDQNDLGSARETMVHMTSIELDLVDLIRDLEEWDCSLRNKLLSNMKGALSPIHKNSKLTEEVLPSASEVKERIYEKIECEEANILPVNDDIDIIEVKDNKLLVIKPDASGFILTNPNGSLPNLLSLASRIGLQIVTYYAQASDRNLTDLLVRSKMEPAMIRPWQTVLDRNPHWEVGWRKTMNGYQDSLHLILLDEQIEHSVRKFIIQVEDYVS